MTTVLQVLILLCAFINVFNLGFQLGTKHGYKIVKAKKENE